MNIRKIVLALASAFVVVSMSGCATDKVAGDMHRISSNWRNFLHGKPKEGAYDPATTAQVGYKRMFVLNQFIRSLGMKGCLPRGAKIYEWPRVTADEYHILKYGPPSSAGMGNMEAQFGSSGGFGGAEGKMRQLQSSIEEDNSLYHTYKPMPDDYDLHVAIAAVKDTDAAAGMSCNQVRSISAGANALVRFDNVEAWINKGQLDTIWEREIDLTGKNRSVTHKLTWADVQSYIDEAYHKIQRDNF